MFALRKETDYALQLLSKLSKKKDGPLSLKTLSEEMDISFLFLQKIARKLRIAGIVKAEQGVKGGYILKVLPKDLSLFKIIKIMEGDCAILSCFCRTEKPCKRAKICKVRKKLTATNQEIGKILEKIKLSDL